MSTRSLIEAFFAGIKLGKVDEALLTEDMVFWSVNSGEADRQRFQMGIGLLAKIANQSICYSIDNFMLDGDQIATEISSCGNLINGETLENTHVFLFQLRDGKIAVAKEYMNQYMDPHPI